MTEFRYEKVKDPLFFKENVLPAHSAHGICRNREEALAGNSSLRMTLDGVWKFSYAANQALAPAGFEKEEYDCRCWESICVPAHIQMEGYDAPQYANVQYPWDGREELEPGEIPVRFNPTASYVKYFEVPEAMKGKTIRISFQGVESGMALWLNGSYVGYSEDSFTPSEFDLTSFLKEGENKLAVQVYKWTSSSWCEDQDFFRFSGIYRSVYLYAVPSVHIEDIRIKTLFEEQDFGRAVLEVRTKTTGTGSIRCRLKDGQQVLFEREKKIERKADAPQAADVWEWGVTFRENVQNPALWSAEEPYLYELEMEAVSASGEVEEYTVQQVGFRKFEMKDNRMLLNGKRIVFRGVNRHEFSSVSGRHVSYEELEKDIVTMKRNNINAIRTCHYPDDTALYDLCDRYGLYLIAECNMETHGTWDAYLRGVAEKSFVLPGEHENWEGMMLDRVNSCYQRDKNHPAVLLWSCGNESFGGRTIFRMSELFRKLDDTRLVHYEGVFHDRSYDETTDVESRMYAKVQEIEEYLKEPDARPFICCEYSHAMGNSCGALHKYTNLADKENSGYQGGFIWDYIDQSLYQKDRYGKEYQAYGGDFGERPCDYNFSGNGIVYGGERNPSPKMQEVKFNYQNLAVFVHEKDFEVWNKNLFVNADTFDAKAILQRNGVSIDEKELHLCVEPESRQTFPLPFEIPAYAGEYAVTVSFHLKKDTLWAKAGHEVAFGQAVVADAAPESRHERKPYTLIRGKRNFGVRGTDFEALFSIDNGFVSYRYAGKEFLVRSPRPNFWRAPVDNDEGNNMPGRCGQWKLASLYLTTKGAGVARETALGPWYDNPIVREEADCAVITYYYSLQTKPAAECRVTYRVYGDGRVQTTLSYDPVEGLGDMPEFGMLFQCSADYDHVEWYGNGPEETYEDRKEGAKLGIYRNLVKDNLAQYLVPQECGNKTGVRYAKITDRKGRGLLFTGDKMNFSALPYTPHELENARHPFELPEAHYTYVRVSKQQMGVGGDDSWGAPVHPEYLIDVSKKLEFTFTFCGIV
ncbi:MAG: DUF4981 domain-containing protein [Blautia sp.]|nr:DUF4981 domain-containing protein [Blautia sp.]MCM1199993.1 DUF4981 domain-containing protein [Bacteroides fragilis]